MTGTRNIDAFFNFESQSNEDAEKVTKEVVVIDTVNKPMPSADLDVMIVELSNVEQHCDDMDEIAETAMTAYEDILEAGNAADERNCAMIFTVAAQMMKNALDAKTAKNSARLRAADMLLKKKKYDDTQELDEVDVVENEVETGGVMTSRNKILEALKDSKGK